MTEQSTPLEQIGRTIGDRYVVEEILGRGGMAAVYRVRDSKTGTKLALKRGWARDQGRARKRQALLEREYHTLAQLAHPRIIEVYDFGVDERGPYYTMELLDGADLNRGNRLPWREACALLRDVASSLAILHSRGLVHRDVSSRNVRCGADGRAKLIDFGAMASMGVVKEVVGTPPFMAPEVLQMQLLDARVDLFSLGALGYYLLTGRHAYPARRINELRDMWRSSPVPPIRILPELPPALSALILQLIALDRCARPSSAAEVMERLCAIAGLPTEEQVGVSRAYLTTPTLVGRDKALLAMRKRMLSVVRGDGGTLLIEGVAGSGRSRLLDACALDGKLLGATVVRADSSDAANGDWGVARAIGTQLLELFPKEAKEATRLSKDVLAHVLEGLAPEVPSTLSAAAAPERSLLIRELRDFVLALARAQRLLIVIDDADCIDEPSAALIAALAHKTERHALLLALAVDKDRSDASSATLRLLRSVSESIVVEQLAPEQTEALMRSVFGDAANLPQVAGHIHALAHGNPRAAMELAQHLVDRGFARYEAGSWLLPARIDEGDLPSSLSASLSARLDKLSADARELADVLCLADGDSLTLDSYAVLTAYVDQARVFRALDELVAARVLVADAERYRFSQRGFLAVLHATLPAARRTAICGRLADLLAADGGDVLRRAQHLFDAGRDGEALGLLGSVDLLARLPPLPLLERAVQSAERHKLPARAIHSFRMAVVSKASLVLAVDSFRRWVTPVLAQLEQDSGLLRYEQLALVPSGERLVQALAQTQQRYQQTPERDRVYPVFDAIRELGRLTGAFTAMAITVFDPELLDLLPSLEPLLPLSPALSVVIQLVEAIRDWIRGKIPSVVSIHRQLLARIAEPDRGGLDEAQYVRTRTGIENSLGLLEAAMGISSAEIHAASLERVRELRVAAWRVRMLLHLSQGNAEEARKCQRRAELVQLQEGPDQRFASSAAGLAMLAYSRADDLLGVKSMVEALGTLADQHPGWRPHLNYGLARYRELQGDPEGALELVLAALELAKAGRHNYFNHLAGLHVSLLHKLGRVAEARERGLAYVEICDREGLMSTDFLVYVATAEACVHEGEHERGLRMIESVIETAVAEGRSGLALGTLYESRARIAIWMNDKPAFEAFAERCASEYNKGHDPTLRARFARLFEDAHHDGIDPSEPAAQSRQLISVSHTDSEYDTIYSRMQECVDQNDRARCALTMLLQSTDTFAGYLYGVDHELVVPLAWIPDLEPEPALGEWVAAHVRAERKSAFVEAIATADATEEMAADLSDRYTDQEGRSFQPVMLTAVRGGRQRIAAVLALQVTQAPRNPLDKRLLAELADQLLEQRDVAGVTLEPPESVTQVD